jgi:hypothetical protein
MRGTTTPDVAALIRATLAAYSKGKRTFGAAPHRHSTFAMSKLQNFR